MEYGQAGDTGELAQVRLPLVVAVDMRNDFLDAAVTGGFDHGARMMPPVRAATRILLALNRPCALAEQVCDRQRPGFLERNGAQQSDLGGKLAFHLVVDRIRLVVCAHDLEERGRRVRRHQHVELGLPTRRHHELTRGDAMRERFLGELNVDVQAIDGQFDVIGVVHFHAHFEALLEHRRLDGAQPDERDLGRLEIRRQGGATAEGQGHERRQHGSDSQD